MSATLTCPSCATVLGIPKGGVPTAGLTCNWCGHTVSASSAAPAAPKSADPRTAGTTGSATPATSADRPSSRPADRTRPPAAPSDDRHKKASDAFANDASAKERSAEGTKPKATRPTEQLNEDTARSEKPVPHRWADDEDDDGRPYDMPQEPAKFRDCEDCGKQIDVAAVICVHCGYDAKRKEKAERTYTSIDKEWGIGWSLQTRISVFVGCQLMNVATYAVSYFVLESPGAGIVAMAMMIGLQAFLLGTFPTLRLRRNKRGQCEMILTWRVCFLPQPQKKLDWKSAEGITWGVYDGAGYWEWYVMLSLLCFGIIPALIWWWKVIQSDRQFTALARDQGYPDVYLYRGLSEAKAKEIAQTVSDATGLPLIRPL